MELKRQDYGIIAGGFLLAVLAGFLGQLYNVTGRIELYTQFVTTSAILVTLYFIHQGRRAWGGDLARYLEIIGIGFALLMLTWVPHIQWHIGGEPAWLSLSGSFWVTFFHVLTAVTFLIVGYGFYWFWQEG